MTFTADNWRVDLLFQAGPRVDNRDLLDSME
jgi:hypothetical protein